MLIVISPLNSLISDQVASCESMGLKACKLEQTNAVDLQRECGFDMLYASPEVFDSEDAKKVLQLHCDRIIGVVVDESLCIVNW